MQVFFAGASNFGVLELQNPMCLTVGFRRIVKGFQGSMGPSIFSNTRAETDQPPYIGVLVVEGRPNVLRGGP